MQFCQFLGCENLTCEAFCKLTDGKKNEALLTERKSVLHCFILPAEILAEEGGRVETWPGRGCLPVIGYWIAYGE